VATAVALTFLLAGSYVVENLRGERAWARAQARMAKEGESLEPTRLWPDPLPPGENAATTPALDGLVEVVDRDEAKGAPAEKRARLAALDIHHQSADPRPALVPGAIHWPAWRDYLTQTDSFPPPADEPDPAKAVFAAFAPQEALFVELAEAAAVRPKAQFTPTMAVRMFGRPLHSFQAPYLKPVSSLAQAVALRGHAAVALGHRDSARGAVQTLFRLREALAGEATLVGVLVGASVQAHATTLLLDGLAARLWTDDEYLLWSRELAGVDWQEAVLRALRVELVSQLELLESAGENWHQTATEFPDAFGEPRPIYSLYARAPRGWFRQHQAHAVTWHLDHLIGPLRDGSWPELLAQMEPLRQRIQQAKNQRNPHVLLLTIGPPISITLSHKIIRLEYTRRQTVAACALERHFLQHQSYPDTLSSLVPAFLPAVPEDLDGRPLRYALDPLNARFRLWSVGTNLTDEGQGNPSPNPSPIGHGFRHEEEADWVLRFPAENP